ncbi:MAG: chromate resistance protein [Alphaproteobacteria bacterium]|nr:chromate resistance protein [Alphaproteobacteria bacterium]
MRLGSKTISCEQLIKRVGSADYLVVVDVRRRAAFEADDVTLPAALWRDHTRVENWLADMPMDRPVVVYCVHGHQVSRSAVSALRLHGVDASILDGGIDAYRAAGGPVVRQSPVAPADAAVSSRWVTRERPKIDRVACPWFIRRFVDARAEIHYVHADWVIGVAEELGGVPFDVPDVDFTHDGDRCSFDAFLDHFGVDDPSLRQLAEIVRGADTARLDLAPQAAGLLAMALGMSAANADDHATMEKGFVLYDALYAWLRFASDETHNWPVVAAGVAP